MFALVGSLGAELTGTAGNSVTPSFGTGENRTAGNLLILWCVGAGAGTLPGNPVGWTTGPQVGVSTVGSCSVFWKIAAGGDSAPSITGATGVGWRVMLGEFTGVSSLANPVSQSGTNTGTTGGTLAATAGGTDAEAGALVITAGLARYSAASSTNTTDSFNNGGTANTTSNSGSSAAAHYDLAWGITTGNGSADSDTMTMSITTNLTNTGLAIISFRPNNYIPLPAARVPYRPFAPPFRRVRKAEMVLPGQDTPLTAQPTLRRPPVKGLPRRGHSADAPVPQSAVVVNPNIAWFISFVRRRGLRPRYPKLGREFTGPQIIPPNPNIAWTVEPRRRGLLVRKGRSFEATPPQSTPVQVVPARRRGLLPRRRTNANVPVAPPAVIPNPPIVFTSQVRRRGLKVARGKTVWSSFPAVLVGIPKGLAAIVFPTEKASQVSPTGGKPATVTPTEQTSVVSPTSKQTIVNPTEQQGDA